MKYAKSICTDRPFQAVAVTRRIVAEWSGVLYGLPKYRHLLRCEHLRWLPHDGLEPFRAEQNFTHQFWVWGQKRNSIEPGFLLYRGQFDLGHWQLDRARHQQPELQYVARKRAEDDIDGCARLITELIAKTMLKAAMPTLEIQLEDILWADLREYLTKRLPIDQNPRQSSDWLWTHIINHSYSKCPYNQPV